MDDAKMFIRAVLQAAEPPGLPQSRIQRDYLDLTGEALNFRKFGFESIFDLLKNMEGEVTRLEFNANIGDNSVFVVLDPSVYASQHAIKNSNKTVSNIPAKNPTEILQWRRENNFVPGRSNSRQDQLGRRSKHRSPGNGGRGSKSFLEKLTGQYSTNHDLQAPANEQVADNYAWMGLSFLNPDNNGHFTIYLDSKSTQAFKGSKEDVFQYFRQYHPYTAKMEVDRRATQIAFVRFTTFLDGFQAWQDMNGKVVNNIRLNMRPAPSRLGLLTKPDLVFHKVSVGNLPQRMHISSIVRELIKYPGLVHIQPKMKTHNYCDSVTATYLNESSIQMLCQKLNRIQVGSQTYLVTVAPLNQPKPVAASMTPAVSSASAQEALVADEAQWNTRLCGFSMDLKLRHTVLETLCRRSIKLTTDDFPDRVELTLTDPVDSCRFWAIVTDDLGQTRKDLEEIERTLADTSNKIQAQYALPAVGIRGAALYEENKSWYRCYVLETYPDKDLTKVFFCDYGNVEVVSRTCFRSTYPDVWKFPPQAVPCKINGLENNFVKSETVALAQALQNLVKNLRDDTWTAKLVKSSTYSQPHILELSDFTCLSAGRKGEELSIGKFIDCSSAKLCDDEDENDIQEEVVAPTEEDEDGSNLSEAALSETDDEDIIHRSFFSYTPDKLRTGRLSEVVSCDLVFLQFNMPVFNSLELLLSNYKPSSKVSHMEPNKIALLWRGDLKRRVEIIGSGVDGKANQVALQLIDYGKKETVDRNYIYELDEKFSMCPYQARPASLVGICDFSEGHKNAHQLLKHKLHQTVRINVLNESCRTGKIEVELFDPSRESSINVQLFEGEFAKKMAGFIVTKNKHLQLSQQNNRVDTENDSAGSTLEKQHPIVTGHNVHKKTLHHQGDNEHIGGIINTKNDLGKNHINNDAASRAEKTKVNPCDDLKMNTLDTPTADRKPAADTQNNRPDIVPPDIKPDLKVSNNNQGIKLAKGVMLCDGNIVLVDSTDSGDKLILENICTAYKSIPMASTHKTSSADLLMDDTSTVTASQSHLCDSVKLSNELTQKRALLLNSLTALEAKLSNLTKLDQLEKDTCVNTMKGLKIQKLARMKQVRKLNGQRDSLKAESELLNQQVEHVLSQI